MSSNPCNYMDYYTSWRHDGMESIKRQTRAAYGCSS